MCIRDSLNGVLYIDKLTAPENFWTEEEFEKAMEQVDEEEVAEVVEPTNEE